MSHFPMVEVAAWLSVLEAANIVLADLRRPEAYAVRLASWRRGPVASSSGIVLTVSQAPRRLVQSDAWAVLAGGAAHPGRDTDAERRAALAWLNAHAQHLSRVVTVGQSAAALVQQSAYDCRRAGNGACARAVADALNTSASRGSALALAWVAHDAGSAIASKAALRLSSPLLGTPPAAQTPCGTTAETLWGDVRLDNLRKWIAKHLDQPMPVHRMAEQLSMSERTLARLFRRHAGTTPAIAVMRLRVEAACKQLANGQQPVKRIALLCGFSSSEVMRRAFLRHLRLSPQEFRDLQRRCAQR